MPVINPLWVAAMRRQWPLVGAVVTFLVFLLVHVTLFRPAADQYRSALRDAQRLGLSIEQATAPEVIPPKVYAMLADNAIPANVAKESGDSGTLSASLIEDVTRMAAARHMEIVVTEPGPTAQQQQSMIVRAHLKVRARFADLLGLLEDLTRGDKLYAVDRFSVQPTGDSTLMIDLYLSRYILKQVAVRP